MRERDQQTLDLQQWRARAVITTSEGAGKYCGGLRAKECGWGRERLLAEGGWKLSFGSGDSRAKKREQAAPGGTSRKATSSCHVQKPSHRLPEPFPIFVFPRLWRLRHRVTPLRSGPRACHTLTCIGPPALRHGSWQLLIEDHSIHIPCRTRSIAAPSTKADPISSALSIIPAHFTLRKRWFCGCP